MFIFSVTYNASTTLLKGPTECPFSIRRLAMFDLSLCYLNKHQSFLTCLAVESPVAPKNSSPATAPTASTPALCQTRPTHTGDHLVVCCLYATLTRVWILPTLFQIFDFQNES